MNAKLLAGEKIDIGQVMVVGPDGKAIPSEANLSQPICVAREDIAKDELFHLLIESGKFTHVTKDEAKKMGFAVPEPPKVNFREFL